MSQRTLEGKSVAATRPMPEPFDVAPAELREGPPRGFDTRDDAIEFCKHADAVVSWITDRIDAEFLDTVGEQLRVVANFAVGFDNIDLDACRERRVRVTNTPDAVTDGTADCACMLILAACRKLAESDRFCRSGDWQAHGVLGPADRLGQPVGGMNLDGSPRTLLIVGAGRIGYATATRMIGFGLRTLYTARSPKPAFESPPLAAERVTLEDGLKRADIVSLHTPLTPDTRHLIGDAELRLMKPTAVLVNTARGPVVDEEALAAALAERRIFAAGLDVFEREPAVLDALKALDNVVMTPHFGSGSTTSRARMARLVADNVRAVLEGREPPTPVV